MNRNTQYRRRGSIIGVDVLVSITLLMGLAALMTDTVMRYRANQNEWYWRQAAILAADAQLKRYEAGMPLDSKPPPGVIPQEITLETRSEPGQGDWSGFSRITVVSTAVMPNGRKAREQMSTYLRSEGSR